MKKCLIDTNIISYFLEGNTAVVSRVSAYLEVYDTLIIPELVVYEVLSGLYHRDSKKLLAPAKRLLEECSVIPAGAESIEVSAWIYAELYKTGKPIDDMDILIAGIALSNNLTLVTNNEKHFSRIPALQLENWTY